MALIPFGQYEPDLTDLDTNISDSLSNVLPRADGYGPIKELVGFTQALPAASRGMFYARNGDGTVTVFAGTATKLYVLRGSDFNWTDVSLGGAAYSALPNSDMWRFVQFNTFVVAVNINVAPQVYDLSGSTAFANLGGSPPQGRHIAVVGRFLVITGISGSPYRVQWSGLNAITTWDNVTAQSNYQDLPDGGIVREVAGGEFGIIFQDASIRRMIFVGGVLVFQIERIAQDDGLYAPYAVVRASDEIHFLSPKGFKKIVAGGYPVAIGKERVDRTFFDSVDRGSLQLIIGAAELEGTRVYWGYKTIDGQTGLFDTMLIYDQQLDKWTTADISGEYISTLSRPGTTLEALDASSPGIITISNAVSSTGVNGPIRLTISGLTAGSGTGNTNLNSTSRVEVYDVHGTTEANANWNFTIIDSTHIVLTGSTFTNAYTSGGAIGGSLDQIEFSFDDLATTALPRLAIFDSSNILGFLSGDNMEATLDTPEQDAQGQRMFITGLRMHTDAGTVYGRCYVRDTPMQSTFTSTSETLVNAIGVCPQRIETRYARGRMRIPAGTVWSYAMGIEPQVVVGGER